MGRLGFNVDTELLLIYYISRKAGAECFQRGSKIASICNSITEASTDYSIHQKCMQSNFLESRPVRKMKVELLVEE